MKIVEFDREESCILQFLELPKRLYGPGEIMQNTGDEERLLRGTHFLNRYVTLTKFLLLSDDGRVGARCVLTEYEGDETAYFGFFECVDDGEAASRIIGAVEKRAAEKGYRRLAGPLDVSIWIRYRFKVNLFDRRPYTGEPYNKPYYQQLFLDRGYVVRERYASNLYRKLPRTGYELPKYRERYEDFLRRGYEIRSPRDAEWDKCIREVYRLVSELYTGFEAYKPIAEEEFVTFFSSYRRIVDFSMIKLAWFQGRAVGFFMGIPNYHNLGSRKIGVKALAEVLVKKVRCSEYVLLYMGVEPEHRGLGKALTHSIMAELAKKGATSVGSLIRCQNINYNYAQEMMEEERYHYVFLEKGLSDTGLSER